MKNLRKLFILLGLFLLVATTKSNAQISFSVGLRFAPAWAPVEYAHHTRYYYLPDLDAYYDAALGGYYFHDQDGDDWFFTRTLPDYFQGFDFYSCPKVELEYFGDRPFEFFRDRRFEFFHEYHPDGLIPYYHHEDWRINNRHEEFYNREGDHDFHEKREYYNNQGNNWERRNQNNFNPGFYRDQNRFHGNDYREGDIYSGRRGQFDFNHNQNSHSDFPIQNYQTSRNRVNGERNPEIVRDNHFHDGGDRREFRRNSFN